MIEKIRDFAAVLRTTRKSGNKFVVILGAGASLSSGMMSTRKIKRELLREYGSDIEEDDPDAAFDKLWERTPEGMHANFFRRFKEQGAKRSPGYDYLAKLIAEGYFDVVVTFNYDSLLEDALKQATQNAKSLTRGVSRDSAFLEYLDHKEPRVRVFKVHGSVDAPSALLFSVGQMDQYPEPIHQMFQRLTRGHVLVCGYGFEDDCVRKAFSRDGGYLYCVNPQGAPRGLQPILTERHSTDFVVRTKFDEFFAQLYQFLHKAPPSNARNPFKYLDVYSPEDKEWFFGREELTAKTLEALDNNPPLKSLLLYGKPQVGKTSFVKAGLIGQISQGSYEPVYLRCRANLDSQLSDKALELANDQKPSGLKQSLDLISRSGSSRCLLILDQFERTLRARDSTEEQLLSLAKEVVSHDVSNLTVVLVARDESPYWRLIAKLRPDEGSTGEFEIPPLAPPVVEKVIRGLLTKGKVQIEDDVITELINKFEAESDFTLAHVQAICHRLVAIDGMGDLAEYKRRIKEDRDSLDRAICESDIINFIQDFPLRHERCLARNLMKILSSDSRLTLAEWSQKTTAEVLCQQPFPGKIGEEVFESD